ncbi:hypothetical protein CGH71_23695, partial [Vibrio parahaemolyticus]
ELRTFYFSYARELADNIKLERAWLKEVSSSRVTESSDLLEGLFSVLSKSVFMTDIGSDKIRFTLAKDRS